MFALGQRVGGQGGGGAPPVLTVITWSRRRHLLSWPTARARSSSSWRCGRKRGGPGSRKRGAGVEEGKARCACQRATRTHTLPWPGIRAHRHAFPLPFMRPKFPPHPTHTTLPPHTHAAHSRAACAAPPWPPQAAAARWRMRGPAPPAHTCAAPRTSMARLGGTEGQAASARRQPSAGARFEGSAVCGRRAPSPHSPAPLHLALRRQQRPGEGAAAAGVDGAGRQQRRGAGGGRGGGKGRGRGIQRARAALGRQRPAGVVRCTGRGGGTGAAGQRREGPACAFAISWCRAGLQRCQAGPAAPPGST